MFGGESELSTMTQYCELKNGNWRVNVFNDHVIKSNIQKSQKRKLTDNKIIAT